MIIRYKFSKHNKNIYCFKRMNSSRNNLLVEDVVDVFEYIDNEDEISRNNNPNLLKSIKKIIKK